MHPFAPIRPRLGDLMSGLGNHGPKPDAVQIPLVAEGHGAPQGHLHSFSAMDIHEEFGARPDI